MSASQKPIEIDLFADEAERRGSLWAGIANGLIITAICASAVAVGWWIVRVTVLGW